MKLKNTKLREGDEVIVISGKEKGKRGNIKQIIGSKCVINDLNLAKRHTRPNPQLGVTGGIVEKAMPIDLSNVMIWNSSAKKRDRVGFKLDGAKKSRIFKSTGKEIK
ncbi:MAG: 50S ribosomal protein L24 [Proteobacteria bacterium]|nr:50S ribosomal protein L24 [Pseudomonadota bacterium]MDA0899481.1 50S ribosomal protein L24 [Pseudomonadota bacterium]MDA1056245.1 50S ribosomal protein L24 [Pseudomonadota bacterium]